MDPGACLNDEVVTKCHGLNSVLMLGVRSMKHIVLLAIVMIYPPLFSCGCLKGRTKVTRIDDKYQHSPTKIETGDEKTAQFQAAILIAQYKKTHPSEVEKMRTTGLDEQGIDRELMRKHLRTASRHTSHLTDAFAQGSK